MLDVLNCEIKNRRSYNTRTMKLSLNIATTIPINFISQLVFVANSKRNHCLTQGIIHFHSEIVCKYTTMDNYKYDIMLKNKLHELGATVVR